MEEVVVKSKVGKRGKPKGTPRTPGSGRQKGTRNKTSGHILVNLADNNIDLIALYFQEVAKLNTPQEKIAEYKYMFSYVFPQLKQLDQLPALNDGPAIDITSLIKAAKG